MSGYQLLAFDTSTELMSIAVSCKRDGVPHIWQHLGSAGSQASSNMVGAIMDLLAEAEIQLSGLDAICFGSGPGSFTGLRTACSVAQGLAFGANVPVLPIDTLLAVAEDARWTTMQGQQAVEVTALIDARMDEMYAARYGYANNQWVTLQTSYLVRPEELQTTPIMAGNVFEAYGARIPMCAHEPHQRISAFPSAAALLRLAPQFLQAGLAVAAEHALPEYTRNKVAKTTEERVAEKAAFQSAQAESGV